MLLKSLRSFTPLPSTISPASILGSTLRKRTFYTTKTELPPLVSGAWLATQLERENVKVVDGSFHLPAAKRDAAKEFSQQRIPGATFFDINEIRDKKSPYPRMMPTAHEFEVFVSEIGITNDDIVVVYDSAGIFSSPRVWYMLKAFGHRNVSVLDGGFPLWKKEMRAIEEGPMTGAYQSERKAFTAKYNKQSVANARTIHRWLSGVDAHMHDDDTDVAQIVDARHYDRYLGKEDEGPGKKRGHIPGSVSLHYKRLLNKDGLTLRAAKELKQEFDWSGVDLDKSVISTCGSGVSAAMINFAIHVVQWEAMMEGTLDEAADELRQLCMYDGSWAEWGSLPNSVVSMELDQDTGVLDVEMTRGPLDNDDNSNRGNK